MEELIHGSNLEDSGVLHRLVSEVGIRAGLGDLWSDIQGHPNQEIVIPITEISYEGRARSSKSCLS